MPSVSPTLGSSKIVTAWIRRVGFIGAVLFAAVALRVFMGAALTPLSQPLRFFAYPCVAATLVEWRGCTIEVPPDLASRRQRMGLVGAAADAPREPDKEHSMLVPLWVEPELKPGVSQTQ